MGVTAQARDRLEALEMARDFVAPIVEQHGLFPFNTGANVFVVGAKTTAVDQHLCHVMVVADWLLQESD